MKTKILLLLVMLMFTLNSNWAVEETNQTKVYICTGPQSKRYHKTSSCRGLNSCSGEVKAVSVVYAKSIGRTQCGWCYKNK